MNVLEITRAKQSRRPPDEDFMIAANEVMRGRWRGCVLSIRRVVKRPERWARMVDLAGSPAKSSPEPDSGALNAF